MLGIKRALLLASPLRAVHPSKASWRLKAAPAAARFIMSASSDSASVSAGSCKSVGGGYKPAGCCPPQTSVKIATGHFESNKDPILAELRRFLPAVGERKAARTLPAIAGTASGTAGGCRVLEIGGGGGQHAAYFVQSLAAEGVVSRWLPSDRQEPALASMAAYRAELPAPLRDVMQPPQAVDVLAWPKGLLSGDFDAVLAVNVLQVSPPEVADALLSGAAGALRPGGRLFVYGPFMVDGKPTTESNRAFHERLRGMDPRFGLRDVGELSATGAALGLRLIARQDMPSNNFMLVFDRE